MKYLASILICLSALNFLHAQYCENCIPKDWIVTGDNVNFRFEPNTNSTPIGKLTNGELLTFKEIAPGNQHTSWTMINESWIRVKRISTGESGFVYGKFVRPQEMIHPDKKRIQAGKLYGIYMEKRNIVLEKLKPVYQINDSGDTILITGHDDQQVITISSQSELKEGTLSGRIYTDHEGNLTIGQNIDLLSTTNRHFSIACTGEVELNDFMGFTRIDERIIFITEVMDGSQRQYSKQDLTPCIHKFGEVGYHLIFAGDLNDDGIPEIIFSEADTRSSVIYYFMSNSEGILELKSISGGEDKC